MKIKVTQDHINRGKCADARKCAVALAIFDAIGERLDRVGCFNVELMDRKVDLPPEAMEWILNFDTASKAGAQPFEFDLDI